MGGGASGWSGKNRGLVLEEFQRVGTLYQKTCRLLMHDMRFYQANVMRSEMRHHSRDGPIYCR